MRLNHSRDPHTGQDRPKTKQVISKDVSSGDRPSSLLEIRHRFERVTGKCRERSAETDYYEQSPARIYDDALGRPDEKESGDKTADNVDEQRAKREAVMLELRGQATQDMPKIRARDGCDGYSEEVFHDGVLLLKIELL
jgi:hypothetical protein